MGILVSISRLMVNFVWILSNVTRLLVWYAMVHIFDVRVIKIRIGMGKSVVHVWIMVLNAIILNNVLRNWFVRIIIVNVHCLTLNIGPVKHRLVKYVSEKIFFFSKEFVIIFLFRQIRPWGIIPFSLPVIVYRPLNTILNSTIYSININGFLIGHRSISRRIIPFEIIFTGHQRTPSSIRIISVMKPFNRISRVWCFHSNWKWILRVYVLGQR